MNYDEYEPNDLKDSIMFDAKISCEGLSEKQNEIENKQKEKDFFEFEKALKEVLRELKWKKQTT